jgi:uncharacterized protein (TIGR02147 family)
VFDFKEKSYKDLLSNIILDKPKSGRGIAKALAQHLNSSSVAVSQILKGDRDLSDEQAYKTSLFFGFTELETKYFLKLVTQNKAANFEYRGFLENELKKIRLEAKKVKSRYKNYKELKEVDKAIFYSDKYYSATRILTSLDSFNTPEELANYLSIPTEKVEEVLDFLMENKLVEKTKNDELMVGSQHTFIPADSIHIKNHHRNWRLHSLERVNDLDLSNELMYTAPIALSHEDYQKLRDNILAFIKETLELLGPSKEETVGCFSIDLVKF